MQPVAVKALRRGEVKVRLLHWYSIVGDSLAR